MLSAATLAGRDANVSLNLGSCYQQKLTLVEWRNFILSLRYVVDLQTFSTMWPSEQSVGLLVFLKKNSVEPSQDEAVDNFKRFILYTTNLLGKMMQVF